MSALWEPIAGPEGRAHGAAFSAFVRGLPMMPVVMGDAAMRNYWLVFLAGWLAKARQADELRGRR